MKLSEILQVTRGWLDVSKMKNEVVIYELIVKLKLPMAANPIIHAVFLKH